MSEVSNDLEPVPLLGRCDTTLVLPGTLMSQTGNRTQVPLDQLLLDPNNFRFRDQDRWRNVGDVAFAQPATQRKAERLIAGEDTEQINDLLESLRANGWLEVDQIQVRPWGDEATDKYVVVEGNRRVTALRHLKRALDEEGEDSGKLPPSFFDQIPVVVQGQEDRVQHLIHMGLVHITGKRRWSQLSQSLAIRELREEHDLSEREVCSRLAVTMYELRLSMRALYLCDAYEKSDWGEQFSVERYTLLREVVRNPAIKRWIEWDDDTYTASNAQNQERLFSLISAVTDELDPPGDGDDESVIVQRKPALSSRDHVRRLGKLIDAGDERAIRNLEHSRDLTAAELASEELGRDRVRNAVALIDDQANQLFGSIGFIDNTHAAQISQSVQKIAGLWMASGRDVAALQRLLVGPKNTDGTLDEIDTVAPDFPPPEQRHLTSVTVPRYRGLRDLKLDGLRRVNILAGLNNSGKTSWLEALRLLVSQVDSGAALDILRRRGRMMELDTSWAAEQLDDDALVEGVRNADGARISVHLRANTDHATSSTHPGYLRSLHITSEIGDRQQHSFTHLYSRTPGRTLQRTGTLQLGPCVHSSPFSVQDPAVLSQLYDAAVEKGLVREVVKEIRTLLDAGIDDIKLTSSAPPRFRVSRTSPPPASGMDLSMYGDGLQRFFQIGLLFAHAQHGFVLLDELENGIHAGLLTALARMIHRFAVTFDTQVFLATHSKEAIDAFVGESDIVTDVRGFSLGFDGGKRTVKGINGEALSRLVELIDADLRNSR